MEYILIPLWLLAAIVAGIIVSITLLIVFARELHESAYGKQRNFTIFVGMILNFSWYGIVSSSTPIFGISAIEISILILSISIACQFICGDDKVRLDVFARSYLSLNLLFGIYYLYFSDRNW